MYTWNMNEKIDKTDIVYKNQGQMNAVIERDSWITLIWLFTDILLWKFYLRYEEK